MPGLQQVAGWVWVTALFPGEQVRLHVQGSDGNDISQHEQTLAPFPGGLSLFKTQIGINRQRLIWVSPGCAEGPGLLSPGPGRWPQASVLRAGWLVIGWGIWGGRVTREAAGIHVAQSSRVPEAPSYADSAGGGLVPRLWDGVGSRLPHVSAVAMGTAVGHGGLRPPRSGPSCPWKVGAGLPFKNLPSQLILAGAPHGP